jgi:hypothetical protein
MGFIGAVFSSIPLALSFGRETYDGPPANHLLGMAEARRYVARYNRALLRKTVRDAEESSQGPAASRFSLTPVVSQGFTGFVAHF